MGKKKNNKPRDSLFPSRDRLLDNSPFFYENGKPTRAPTVVTILPEARRTFGQSSASSQHTALIRGRKAVKDAADHRVFDVAVAAEAKRLNRTLAKSAEFAKDVGPGLKKQGFKAGRDRILDSVHRLQSGEGTDS